MNIYKLYSTNNNYKTIAYDGTPLMSFLEDFNFDDYESLQYFQRALIKCGAIKMLENAGIKEGDTVHMYGAEFDFVR